MKEIQTSSSRRSRKARSTSLDRTGELGSEPPTALVLNSRALKAVANASLASSAESSRRGSGAISSLNSSRRSSEKSLKIGLGLQGQSLHSFHACMTPGRIGTPLPKHLDP